MRRSVLTLVVVGAAATGLVLGAQELPVPEVAGQAGVDVLISPASLVPVSGRTVYCLSPAAGSEQRVAVGLAQPSDQGGQVLTAPLDGPGSMLAVAADQVVDADTNLVEPLVVRALGGSAGSLEVEQVTAPAGGGLTGHRCGAAATRLWFTGGSTQVGNTTVLQLVNPDSTPTLVDVSVLSRAGRAGEEAGRGLLVPPASVLTVPMNDLVPDRDLLAVEVVASRGRVAGSLTVSRRKGRVSYGAEQVPASAGPAVLQVVPGVPAGAGGRVLVLSNPGDQTAVAALTLTGGDGQQDPPGLAAVTVPAGRSVTVDLAAYVQQGPMSVTVRSPATPLLAAVFVDDVQAGGPEHDLAYAAAAPSLTAPAILTDVVLRDGTDATLLLTATEGAARVLLTPVAVRGSSTTLPPPQSVAVEAGRSRAVNLGDLLPTGASGRFGLRVEVKPGSGPVHAARYLRSTDIGSTILALVPAAGDVPSPAVRPDPILGRP